MTEIPYRHFVPLPPKEEAKKYVFLNEVKNPTEELTGIYFSLRLWDISLTLNMTENPLSSALPTLPPKEEARLVLGKVKLKYAPGGIAARRIYVFVKKLNVETEKHHVAVFHNVVLALGADFAQFLGFYVTAAV